MNIVQFIRLIQRHLLLLIVSPLVLSVLVYYVTKNQPNKYSSSTTIYTGIASGYNIESQENSRVDFFGTNMAFDNMINLIKSRETMEETALRLIAKHIMLRQPNPYFISNENLRKVRQFPEDVLALADTTNYEQTVVNLYKYKSRNESNFIYEILNFTHPHYSIQAISSMRARRIQSSDLIEINYQTDDPGICNQTLAILTEVFIKNYKGLKENQTDAVVAYFERQLLLASKKLQSAEDKLLAFNMDNKIINYYEQSKFIAEKKEDLEELISKIRMEYASAEAAMERIEENLTDKDKIFLKSNDIVDKRNELADITSQITLNETFYQDDPGVDSKLLSLRQKAERLKEDLKLDVEQLYLYGHSREGISLDDLLTNWLASAIQFEEARASLDVLNNRKLDFLKTYEVFAPLGATLKRIEREIDVSESEYLQILHDLGMAKLRQQNVELSSNIKVVDPPFFPINPLPSKRKFIIIAAGLVGFIIVLALIILLEYFDATIKTPKRYKLFTGLDLAGVFPRFFRKSRRIHFDYINNRLIEMITQTIKHQLQLIDKKEGEPHQILIFSTRPQEGKTEIAERLLKKFASFTDKVVYLNYNLSDVLTLDDRYDHISYHVDDDFIEKSSVDELIGLNSGFNKKDYKYIFIEIPSIAKYPYPVDIVTSVDVSLMVTRANREWAEADRNIFAGIKDSLKNPALGILNGVNMDVLESAIGEVPRKRSFIRRFIKKLVKMNYHTKKSFN